MIQYQILQTNITRTVWPTERRINNEILGVKGLNVFLNLDQNSNALYFSEIRKLIHRHIPFPLLAVVCHPHDTFCKFVWYQLIFLLLLFIDEDEESEVVLSEAKESAKVNKLG